MTMSNAATARAANCHSGQVRRTMRTTHSAKATICVVWALGNDPSVGKAITGFRRAVKDAEKEPGSDADDGKTGEKQG